MLTNPCVPPPPQIRNWNETQSYQTSKTPKRESRPVYRGEGVPNIH
jgi:hypothetical protein